MRLFSCYTLYSRLVGNESVWKINEQASIVSLFTLLLKQCIRFYRGIKSRSFRPIAKSRSYQTSPCITSSMNEILTTVIRLKHVLQINCILPAFASLLVHHYMVNYMYYAITLVHASLIVTAAMPPFSHLSDNFLLHHYPQFFLPCTVVV